jgi:hypothetical protein
MQLAALEVTSLEPPPDRIDGTFEELGRLTETDPCAVLITLHSMAILPRRRSGRLGVASSDGRHIPEEPGAELHGAAELA